MESHEIVNLTGVRTVEVGYRGSEKNRVPREALMLTDDENIVSVQFAVQYLIKDPKNYLFAQRHPDDSVIQAAETSIREVVGKSRMDFVLYESRDQIAASTQKLIQDILDRYDTGIQIRSVNMQSAQPPEQVQSAFDDAVKAGQGNLGEFGMRGGSGQIGAARAIHGYAVTAPPELAGNDTERHRHAVNFGREGFGDESEFHEWRYG